MSAEMEVPHSWADVDLFASFDDLGAPDIGGLLTSGFTTLLSGDSETLKSWLAAYLAWERLQRGEHVIWVDFEMGGRLFVKRLNDMAMPDEERELLHLKCPTEPLTSDSSIPNEILDDLEHECSVLKPALVVFDAMTDLLDLHGWASGSDVDINAAYRLVFDRFRACGAAVLIIDHVVKDPEARGKYASGSQRKVGRADVHLGMESKQVGGVGRTGISRIRVHKDRLGTLPRPYAGTFTLSSPGVDQPVRFDLDLVDSSVVAQADTVEMLFRPTTLMQRASEFAEHFDGTFSKNTVRKNVKGKDTHLDIAVDTLVREGYFSKVDDDSFEYVKPYRSLSDSLPDRVPADYLDGGGSAQGSAPRPTSGSAHGSAPDASLNHADSEGSARVGPGSAFSVGADLGPDGGPPYRGGPVGKGRGVEQADGRDESMLAAIAGLAQKTTFEDIRADLELTPEQVSPAYAAYVAAGGEPDPRWEEEAA